MPKTSQKKIDYAAVQLLRQERDDLVRRVEILAAAARDALGRCEYVQGNYLAERAERIKAEASLARLQAYAQCLPTCESWQRHAEPAHDDVKATAKRCTCGLVALTEEQL